MWPARSTYTITNSTGRNCTCPAGRKTPAVLWNSKPCGVGASLAGTYNRTPSECHPLQDWLPFVHRRFCERRNASTVCCPLKRGKRALGCGWWNTSPRQYLSTRLPDAYPDPYSSDHPSNNRPPSPQTKHKAQTQNSVSSCAHAHVNIGTQATQLFYVCQRAECQTSSRSICSLFFVLCSLGTPKTESPKSVLGLRVAKSGRHLHGARRRQSPRPGNLYIV